MLREECTRYEALLFQFHHMDNFYDFKYVEEVSTFRYCVRRLCHTQGVANKTQNVGGRPRGQLWQGVRTTRSCCTVTTTWLGGSRSSYYSESLLDGHNFLWWWGTFPIQTTWSWWWTCWRRSRVTFNLKPSTFQGVRCQPEQAETDPGHLLRNQDKLVDLSKLQRPVRGRAVQRREGLSHQADKELKPIAEWELGCSETKDRLICFKHAPPQQPPPLSTFGKDDACNFWTVCFSAL